MVKRPASFPKVLTGFFPVPFQLHPHRFRKNFLRTMMIFKHAVMRKVLVAWRKRTTREKVFQLKIRFNIIYDVFCLYRNT